MTKKQLTKKLKHIIKTATEYEIDADCTTGEEIENDGT